MFLARVLMLEVLYFICEHKIWKKSANSFSATAKVIVILDYSFYDSIMAFIKIFPEICS